MNDPFTVLIEGRSHETITINKWCSDTFGPWGRDGADGRGEIINWVVRSGPNFGSRRYVFAREEDALLFTLRWI